MDRSSVKFDSGFRKQNVNREFSDIDRIFNIRKDKNKIKRDNNLQYSNKHISIPRLYDIKTLESTNKLRRALINDEYRIISITISNDSNRYYFASINCKINRVKTYEENKKIVGIDLGILENGNKKALVTITSSNQKNPYKPKIKTQKQSLNLIKIKKYRRKIADLNRSCAQKQGRYDSIAKTYRKPSNSYMRTENKLLKVYRHYKDMRTDFIEKLTHWMVASFGRIKMEDLSITEMLQKKRIAKSLSEAALGTIRRKLLYKMRWYRNKEISFVNRFYPSSKLCSNCGTENTYLKLSDRIFKCNSCFYFNCRDRNASINILQYMEETPESRAGV